ncbi:MAG: hypothetical protein ACKO1N_04080 [Erythrobacter sp.]
MTLGPVSLFLRLAGMPGVAAGDGQDILVSFGLWVLIGVGYQILVTRVAKRMDAKDAPSLTDRFWFFVAPWSGPLVFLLCLS